MPLTNAQYDQLMRDYQERQLQNQWVVTQRKDELYTKIPLLNDIDDKIAECSIRAAKELISGNKDANRQLHQQIKVLHEQKEDLVANAGYPRDYLEPPYKCKDCKDTGYIGDQRCHCFRQAAINLVYSQSHLDDILKVENFDHFDLDYYPKNKIHPKSGISSYEIAKEALETCHSYVDNFGKKGGNLMLLGTPGLGKTFLSNCIAKALLDKSYSVIYFTAFQLLNIFEKATFAHDDAAKQDFENLFTCDLLIIDDLGAELNNSFTNGKLFELINERTLRKKSTVISSNLTMVQLRDTYSDRVISRIVSNYTLIRLYGDDIRVQKKIKQ